MELKERLTPVEQKYLVFLANAIVNMSGLEKEEMWLMVDRKCQTYFENFVEMPQERFEVENPEAGQDKKQDNTQ